VANKPLLKTCLFGHSAMPRLAVRQERLACDSGFPWLSRPCIVAPMTKLHYLGAVLAQGLLAKAHL